MKRVLMLAVIFLVFPVSAAAQYKGFQREFSTFVGGNSFDRAQGVDVDSQGYIYLAINTHLSTNLPTTTGAYDQTSNGGGSDGYIAKLTPDGKTLVWATYLGGGGWDRAYSLKVDTQGYVYVAMWTGSADYPTTVGAYDRTLNDPAPNGPGDVAITKLDPNGASIIYSTYIGGSGGDQARNAIDIDPSGDIYVSGITASTNFPTKNAFQSSYGGGLNDAFVAKLSPDGNGLNDLIFSTYLGGSAQDSANSKVIVHTDGTIFVTGHTRSANFPVTAGAYQTSYRGCTCVEDWRTGDAFVARLSASGSSLIYSTYVGGSSDDGATFNDSLAVDQYGQAVVIGGSQSTDFPLTPSPFPAPFQTVNHGAEEGIVFKLSADGKQLLASTYIGGSGFEETSGVDVDAAGNVYLSGNTHSGDYPVTPNAWQLTHSSPGTSDAMLSVLSPDLSRLLYSTYYGGSGTGDRGRELVLDAANNIVISGDSDSTDFSTTVGAYDRSYNGSTDAIAIKFNPLTLIELLQNWLTNTVDQNRDSKVNSLDFGMLIP